MEQEKELFILGGEAENTSINFLSPQGINNKTNLEKTITQITRPFYEAFYKKADERIRLKKDRQEFFWSDKILAQWVLEDPQFDYKQVLKLRYYNNSSRPTYLDSFDMNISKRDYWWDPKDEIKIFFQDNSIKEIDINYEINSLRWRGRKGVKREILEHIDKYQTPKTNFSHTSLKLKLLLDQLALSSSSSVLTRASLFNFNFDENYRVRFGFNAEENKFDRVFDSADNRKREKYGFPNSPVIEVDEYLKLLISALSHIPTRSS